MASATGKQLVDDNRHASVQSGRVHLTSASPADPVRIEANYLADGQDIEELKKGIRFEREVGNGEQLKGYAG
jgi:choline dehydrogenase